MKTFKKKSCPSGLNLSGGRGEAWGRVAGLVLVLECTLPEEPSLDPPEALGIFTALPGGRYILPFLPPILIRSWLLCAPFPIPPASKEISPQGKIVSELGKNSSHSNNFSLTFWISAPVAFQKLVSVPSVLC